MSINNMVERFWPKVKITSVSSCWEWTACKDRAGYGRLGIDRSGPTMAAHRLSWIIHNVSIPKGMSVLHKCDNPGCVNPSHLFLGTQCDNILDMMEKGRGKPKGAKLSKSEADIIKTLRQRGWSQQKIADLHGIHQTTVSRVVLGVTRFYR